MEKKNVKLDVGFIKDYLDKIKEILGKELGVDPSSISYYSASLYLKKRLDAKGGLAERK